MSSLPAILAEFEKTCQEAFGPSAVGATDRSVFIAFETALVHVNLDETSHRAVVWAEIAWPDHTEVEVLQRAAASFTAREFLTHGLAMGINTAGPLIVLGRSVEQEFLFRYAGLKLLSEIASAVERASAALLQASRRDSSARPDVRAMHP